MAEEIREGYYKDSNGQWQIDRRKAQDRRNIGKAFPMEHERRGLFRRKADREQYELDKLAMQDALQEFADEHHGKI